MDSFSWTCPFCQRPVTITNQDLDSGEVFLDTKNVDGLRVLTCTFIVCPNPKCKKFSLSATLSNAVHTFHPGGSKWTLKEELKTWQLIPPSTAKVFPDYIPRPILDDYEEACVIKDLSPKASATLARRCLQGIIRDFWEVKPERLKNEIEQIKGKVDSLTWEAIDAVRKVGNIGAHMEEDINLIVDVEPNEAELLIGLIETVLKDWYIMREERKTSLTTLVQIAKDKETTAKPEQDTPS